MWLCTMVPYDTTLVIKLVTCLQTKTGKDNISSMVLEGDLGGCRINQYVVPSFLIEAYCSTYT